MDLGLKGLRALVAGSSRGLGFAVAMGLAREGAMVAINGRRAENLQKAADLIRQETGSEVAQAPGDVAAADAPAQIVEAAASALGGLDLLLTNSGGPPAGGFEDHDDEAWERAIDLVFNSHRRLIRAALPHLRKSKAASILTLTSISVKQPIERLILSNSIRAATVGMTKTLAQELGPEGIRVNSILPGWTETERVHQLMEARAQNRGTSKEEEIQKRSNAVPLGRMGRPEEFANAAVFLLSPAASYINGVMLQVDGGEYGGLL